MNMNSSTTTVNGNEVQTGCYVDGHWGQYGSSRVLRIADDLLGTEFYAEALRQEDAEVGSHVDEIGGCESIVEIADEAEAALNAATPDGYSWGWWEGEFMLWTDEDWEEGLF